MTCRLLLLPLALLATGCGGDRTPPAEAPPAPPAAEVASGTAPSAPETLVRGTVRMNPEMTFRPCDGGPIITIVDSTHDRLVPSFSSTRSTDDEGMFILARAVTSPRNQLVLREVQYAVRAGPGEGCEVAAQTYPIMARGSAPAWRLTMGSGMLEFSDSTLPDGIRFQVGAPSDSAGALKYQGSADTHTLHLLLSPGFCSEPKSGALTAMRADVVIDGRALTGCGWRATLP